MSRHKVASLLLRVAHKDELMSEIILSPNNVQSRCLRDAVSREISLINRVILRDSEGGVGQYRFYENIYPRRRYLYRATKDRVKNAAHDLFYGDLFL